jgi:uncharacterized protein (TIGR00725 family)
MNNKVLISVIGGSVITETQEEFAYNVGSVVAKCGAILVCGGLDGSMKASCHGAKDSGGTTIGLLPGKDKKDANPYVDIIIPTTIGFARNACVAASGDIILALEGSHGTSCEISYGLVYKKPIIDLGNWKREGMVFVKDLEEAEQKIKQLMSEI